MTSIRLPLLGAVLVFAAFDAIPAAAQVVQPVRIRRQFGVADEQPTPPVDQATADRKALEAAGLKADDPAGLLGYVRLRTLSDSDLSRIQSVIKRLGADDFEERLKAATEAEQFGPAAVGPLRAAAAQSEADPEVAYRASECLRRMEKVPHSAVMAAVVRALGKSKPADTAKVLLGFLPLSDTNGVADEIRTTLVAVAARDGRAEPALVDALADASPIRRAAAGVALIEGNPSEERIRIKDAYPKVLAAATTEVDPETKFQMLYAILTVAHDKNAVGQLIDLLPTLPRGRLWQAEDFLIQFAGKDAPKAIFGKTKESLAKAKDAWKGWWEKAAGATDLEKFTYTPRVTGKTVIVMTDFRYGNVGTVMELGPDMKERWKIPGLPGAMDAQFLPDGTIAIAEQNSARVTIRDTAGRILGTRSLNGNNRVYGNPQQIQILPDGNMLVVCRNLIVEFKKDKDEQVMTYIRANHDINAAKRLPNGETIVLFQNGPNHCGFLDDKGKDIPNKTLKVGMPFYQSQIAVTAPDRVLITEMNQIAEYDLKDGKLVWSKAVSQPRSVQRLPNGNTLYADAQGNRLIEVTPDGEEVWSFQPTNGLQVFRGYRR
ncbi:PQQ-binding-like beta-propeller repeat protein [Fimbriiglobus ruber]|uniref:Pyrrolo-quinoline quinone repeat domain-containing protein n=1 Tax=Fimbriiglobus ruber TaxID=1908690 RepID=A0A225CZ51_9BACT|nr:PQQ-binding-like beta-propeller repeat protein [Fimbriiglobus ruber]OWK34621.1 hypothetical protein FRUB_10592 [Fimbriiglobus ruber]